MENPIDIAASKLIGLFDLFRPDGHIVPEKIGCSRQELEIFDPHYPTALPENLIRFLEQVLPKGHLDIGVLKSAHPKELLAEQQNSVPLEGNMKHGFFGIGWWTGDTDGDGWLYDLYNGKIYAVQIYNNNEPNRSAVHDVAYHCFDTFSDWVDFLYLECTKRGWLDEKEEPDTQSE